MMPTSERLDGATPNGGAYLIAHYQTADGLPVPKHLAESVEIVEYTPDGKVVSRTYGEISTEGVSE